MSDHPLTSEDLKDAVPVPPDVAATVSYEGPIGDQALTIDKVGHIRFTPGDYLLELELAGVAAPDVFEEGLARMGWTHIVRDEATHPEGTTPKLILGEWGSEGVTPLEGTTHVRVIARTETLLDVMNVPYLRWLYARRVPLDVFADIGAERGPVEMAPGADYDVRFLSRLKGQPTRKDVALALEELGFKLGKAIALKVNMRLPGRSPLTTLWYAHARYEGPEGFLTNEEKLWFEDVVRS